ncbi:MAG: flagellar hook-associated protein FlgL [Pseudomonadota bacterium]
MRIATSQLYDKPMSLMARLSAQADAAQTSIATEKKYQAPSDNAGAYLQLQGLKRAGADDKAYASNVDMARSVLEQGDTTLGNIETQLQRALELTTKAANGTLTDANRVAIAEELDAIRDELFSLANTKDMRGQPLFGGAQGDVAYSRAVDGTISFEGGGDAPAAIPVGEGDSVQASVPGSKLFGTGASDMFKVLGDLSAALRAGGDVSTATGDALTAIKTRLDDVGAGRAMAGARAARLELDADRLAEVAGDREVTRASIEDTDIASAVTELQKTLTVLQATQASFTKLTAMSLFDYLR